MVEPEVTQPQAAKAAPVFHSISWAISRAVAAISKDRTATSLALFGFLIVKVLLVTHGDLLTSLALVNAAGVVAVVIGVVVSSLPIAAAVGMAGALYGCTSCRWRGAGPRKQWSIIALVGLVSAWFTPWFLFVPALALAVLLGAVDWFRASGRPADSVSKLRRGAGRSALVLTVVTLVVATGATLFTMWLPHERLTLSDTPQPAIGYVVADSSGWLSLLISGQRKIERIRDDRVTARSLCRGSDFHESPIQWVARHLGHPFAYLPPCRGRPSGA